MIPRNVPPIDIQPKTLCELLELLSIERLYIVRSLSDHEPVLVHPSLLRTHVHVLGGTGSGKTGLCLLPVSIQLITLADLSVVVLDLKGELSDLLEVPSTARLYIGHSLSDNETVLLHPSLLGTHVHVLGGTGSGKPTQGDSRMETMP